MSQENLQLRSLVTADGTLEVALHEAEIPQPAADEVVVRVEAAPVNPSDLGVMFGPADMSTARVEERAGRPVLIADIPEKLVGMVAARQGKAIPVGNEGAGTVVAAGDSETAQALLGKTVGLFGGGVYKQFHCVNVQQCIELQEGTSAAEGASCFVNPMTALAMVETMRMENHTALVHTAAASNLGQMLNRICIDDGVELVNIVRKTEQETLLRDLGAKYVCNSSSDSFRPDLIEALKATGATLAFDAIGGGRLVGDILSCMEAVASQSMTQYSVYGSDANKQVYIYGSLDRSPTTLVRSFGFSWNIGGFLLIPFLQKISPQQHVKMRSRIASEIRTTFASHYSHSASLAELLSLDALSIYGAQATGQKYLLTPQA